jgi:hypothetical protein
VTTSVGGDAALEREKAGADVSWTDTNFSGPKIKKINTVNLAIKNRR